jgi:hypothetical protein
MNVSMNQLTLSRVPRETEPGYTIGTFARKTQEEFLRQYRKQYPETKPTVDSMRPDRQEVFNAPRGHNPHLEHHVNFYNAVRTRKPFFEDSVFGYRTAGPALLCNTSMYEKRICHWDVVSLAERSA